MSFFDKSICKVPGYLHKFKIVDESVTIVEQCERCGRKAFLRRNPFTGLVSKRLDAQLHQREMLQPWHWRYLKEYPKK